MREICREIGRRSGLDPAVFSRSEISHSAPTSVPDAASLEIASVLHSDVASVANEPEVVGILRRTVDNVGPSQKSHIRNQINRNVVRPCDPASVAEAQTLPQPYEWAVGSDQRPVTQVGHA